MNSFEDVIRQVQKNLVAGPLGAQDMNAGDEFVQQPDKYYGRDREKYEDDEELDKSVVPQHYLPQYGRVQMLYKALPHFGAVIKADDVIRDEYTDREIVVAGYASPQVIDREKHLIQKEGMAKDLPRFLANPMYANAQILHSNVQVGQVLPEWTHPETGKVYKTNVDDIGLFCVIKIRTDKFRPKIVDKVIEDIEKGNLKAFSISGDAPVESREHKCADGQCFWVIPNIELYEITLAATPGTMIQIKGGSKPIEEVRPHEKVITHNRRARSVTQTGKVAYEGDVIEISLDDGRSLIVTPEHRVRVRAKGWIPAEDLQAGDALYDGAPNRLGNLQPESFTAAWHSQHPSETRSGGGHFHTPEGKENQRRSVTSKAFREKRTEIMRMKWADPDIRAAALIKLEETQESRRHRTSDAHKHISDNLRRLRQDPRFNEKMFKAMRLAPNKLEKTVAGRLGPLGFWYTGDGKLVTKSGLVPDFHREDNKVIEVFGDYWHLGQEPQERINRLKEDGLDCLVLWEKDIRESLDDCIARVEEWLCQK